MIKTVITAMLTFMGLKGSEFVISKTAMIMRWFLISVIFLFALKIMVPFSIWYFKSIKEVISPITKPIVDDIAAKKKASYEYYKNHPEIYSKDENGCWCKINKYN